MTVQPVQEKRGAPFTAMSAGVGDDLFEQPANQGLVERYECMDCGHVGPAADLRSHAAQDGCRNFRTTTTRVSSTGKFLGERVEVCQC